MPNRRAARSRQEKVPPGRRVTEGGRQLREYLDRVGLNVPDFSEKHGLDRIRVQRILNGERWQRVTVDFAFAIEKATRGAVRWTAFLSSTAKAIVDRSAA